MKLNVFSWSGHVPQRMKSGTVGLPAYHVFSLEEMEDATNNFEQSNLIGDESHEQVGQLVSMFSQK